MDFIAAYALTILIEGAALYLLLRREYGAAMIARNAIIASSLTLPFVWFVFPVLGMDYPAQIGLSEIFAFAVEAAAYAFLFRGIRASDALKASFACNAASFLCGLALQGAI